MYSQNVTAQILLKVVLRAGKVTEKDTSYFAFQIHHILELRNETSRLPFEVRIKTITLTKTYLWILAVLLNIPTKT